jgi:rsbT co-antagonist protein RsbR
MKKYLEYCMLRTDTAVSLRNIISQDSDSLLADWLASLKIAGGASNIRISEAELRTHCRNFLAVLEGALSSADPTDVSSVSYLPVKDMLTDVSRSRAIQGFTPRETATFIFSLKQPLFLRLKNTVAGDADALAEERWALTTILDTLGLHVMDAYQSSREDVIRRQQEEISELSTPVVKLWQGILALPLIGTLDSTRTQVIMETLLQAIVDEEAEIAIIDITGVPTVDTLVAQHLLKTVAAARLMGADCIISGIRPQIAQTMVHLGLELNVVSKASLADALALALQRTGRMVVARTVPGRV